MMLVPLTPSAILAIVVAAIVNMAVGFVWYLPGVFGNTWMRLTGTAKEKMRKEDMWKAFGGSFVAALVLAFILYQFGSTDLVESLVVAVWLWLGFVVAARLPHFLFERRPMALFALEVAHDLVAILVMSVPLTLLG